MTEPPPRPRPVSRLVDADAGLPDPATAARVRAEAAANPADAAVLDALAATRAELAALPPVPVPDDVATRWDAALAAAAAVPEPVDNRGPDRVDNPRPDAAPPPRDQRPAAPAGRSGSASRRPPTRPGRPRRRRGLRLAAAAVLVVAVAVTGLAVRPEAPRPLTVARVDLAAAARSTLGVADLGALADPRRRAACLAAVGLGPVPADRVLGGRAVVLDGVPGTLLVLATGELGRLRIIVVDPACGAAGRGILLAETVTP